MQKKSLLRKGSAVGIIVLFFGISVIPGICQEIKNMNDGKKSQYNENNSNKRSSLNGPPEEEWNKTFGGSQDDIAYSVQQTQDGGYILTGRTTLYAGGQPDLWVVKTDENGQEQWNHSFGRTEHYDDGCSVVQTSDHGYMLLGNTLSYTHFQGWLIKTDNGGNEQWNKTLGGALATQAFSFQQTTDNGFIVTGAIHHNDNSEDVWLIKTDSDGNTQWNKAFNRSRIDEGFSVVQTKDDGYIIVGRTQNEEPIDADVWLIKTNKYGDEQWSKTFGGPNYDCGHSVRQTYDGGYIITGLTDSYGSGGALSSDVWLVKTDAAGNELWNTTFGSTYDNDGGDSVIQLSDGGYIISGYTHSYGAGWSDVWIIKTNSHGIEQWNKTIGGVFWEEGRCVQQATDGGFIIAGNTDSYGNGDDDFWLIKIAAESETPNLEINLFGGIGVNADIKNNGTADAIGVIWQLHVNGGILGLIHRNANGAIDISKGESRWVSTGLFLGLGPFTIIATANDKEKTATGIILLFYVIVVP